jgi:eukaryotic-like serine/threonine-protein kinase
VTRWPSASAPLRVFTARVYAGWVAGAALLFLGVLAAERLYIRRVPTAAPVVRFNVVPPEQTTFLFGAISPDARYLVLHSLGTEGPSLWMRALDSVEVRPLPGTNNGHCPFWSSDGRHVAFFVDDELRKIPIAGGAPETVCRVPGESCLGTWNRDGVIVFRVRGKGLYRVQATGGTPTAVTTMNAARGDTDHVRPQFLPDGRRFLYYVDSTQPASRGIYVGSLDSAESQRVLRTETSSQYEEPV